MWRTAREMLWGMSCFMCTGQIEVSTQCCLEIDNSDGSFYPNLSLETDNSEVFQMI